MLMTPIAAAIVAWMAAQPAADAPTELDRVVVEGQRLAPAPTPQTELGDAKLQRERSLNADTAGMLRGTPGIDLHGAGGTSSLPSIQGLTGDRVRTRVDGMDLIATCPNHMNPPLSYVDPSALGRLTVYAGMAPVSAGGDSLAGTIIADTRAPRFADGADLLWAGEIGIGARDNGDAWRVDLQQTLASERFSLNYVGAHTESGNLRAGDDFKTSTATGRVGHTLPLDEIGSSAYETNNHALGLAWRGVDTLIEARIGYQDTPFQGYPNQRMDMTDNQQRRMQLRYLGELASGTLEARIYHEAVDHRMDFGPDKRYWYGSNSGLGAPCAPIRYMGDPAGSCAAGMPMLSESTTDGLTLAHDWSLGEQDLLRSGIEWQRYRLDDYWLPSGGGMGPGTFWNIRDGERERRAAYLEWESRPSASWTHVVGLRYESVSTAAGLAQGYSTAAMAMGNQAREAAAFNAQDRDHSDGHWNFSASARYAISDTQELEFGIARRERSPNLYERYAWSSWSMAAAMNNTVGDGNGYFGDPALRPETAWTGSLSWRWRAANGAELGITPYYTDVDDYIDAIPTTGFRPNQFNVLRWANQSARLYGADLDARTAPWRSDLLGTLDLRLRAAVRHGENRDRDESLYQQMPLNGTFSLHQQKGGFDSSLAWELVAAKDRVSPTHTEIPTPGYALVHLRMGYEWQQWRLDAGVDNLFDRGYALPLAGAYVGQGMTMSLNGVPWGTAVPGAGRTVYAGLRYRW